MNKRNKSQKPISIGIVWANPYNKNMGVSALAYSTLSLLKDILQEKGIDATFNLIGSSVNTTGSLIINENIIKFQNIFGLDFTYWRSLAALIVHSKKLHTLKLLKLNYILDIAEGDSFTDIYGNERFKRILSSKIFFSFLNKKQLLLPQTIGPFQDKKREKKAFYWMKKLQMVVSRDKQSYDYTTRYLNTDKIKESIDVAFYLPYTRNEINNGKINVGINISGLLWNGGYTKDNQFNLKADYKNLINNTIQFFTQQKDVQVHLIPHVIPEDFEVENDYLVSKQLQKKYPELILAEPFADPIKAKNYISGMDFFIGARMHSCIAAFSTGVPVFPMAYSRKFNGLFEDTLKYLWIGDCVNEKEDIILENLKQAFLDRDKLNQAVTEANKNIVEPRLDELKETISAFLS